MTLRTDTQAAHRQPPGVNVVADETQDGAYEIRLQSTPSAPAEEPRASGTTESLRLTSVSAAAPASASSSSSAGVIAVAVGVFAVAGLAYVALTRTSVEPIEEPLGIVAPEPVSNFRVYRVEYEPRRVETLSIGAFPADAGSAHAEGSADEIDAGAPIEPALDENTDPTPIFDEQGAVPVDDGPEVEEIDPAVIERIREVQVEIGDRPVYGQPIRRTEVIQIEAPEAE